MIKQYLLAPGPTPIPNEVLLAMAETMIHHRTPQFAKIFSEVREGLKRSEERRVGKECRL